MSSYCPLVKRKRSTLRLHGCANDAFAYIASKDRHHAFWAGMEPLLQEAASHSPDVLAGWQWNAEPDKSPPPSAWSKHALDCLEAASACDVLLFYDSTIGNSGPRWRLPLHCHTARRCSWFHRCRCHSCVIIHAVVRVRAWHTVRVLINMAKGTRARDDAQRHLKGNGGTDPLFVADTRLHSGELING